MTQRYEMYYCSICGNIVEVTHTGIGQLVCCGQPMTLLKPHTEDQGHEKHVPVIEKTQTGIRVKVGSIPHPMEEKHYIEMIEVLTDNGVMRAFLKPGDKPEADFPVSTVKKAREYCTVHGLWRTR